MTPTYSLLQESLEQTIPLDSLQDATQVIRSITRSDCSAIHRDLFGIVVSGLPHLEALAFQAELARRNFPTRIVDDRDVPRLHEGTGIQRVRLIDEKLEFTSSSGRMEIREAKELVFVSAGFFDEARWVTGDNIKWEPVRIDRFGRRTAININLDLDRAEELKSFPAFQLDFFFWTVPNRLQLRVSDVSVGFFNDEPLRLKTPASFVAMLGKIAQLLPPERTNSGLRRRMDPFSYPSRKSYEEEIRWHFDCIRQSEIS